MKNKIIIISILMLSGCLAFYFLAKKNKNDFNSGVTQIKLTKEKTDDLIVLGKIWGYLKYYHPAVAAGKYNWDKELFKILPQIIDSKNLNNRNEILSRWIESLGKYETVNSETIDSSMVKMFPDLAWIDDTLELGVPLSTQLHQIKHSKKDGNNFYVGFMNGDNPKFDNEDSLINIKFPDAGYRLLALYRYWNIIQYFFPYKYLIDDGWNKKLDEFIPEFISAHNELQYKLALLALIANIHDSHAKIYNSDSTLTNYFGRNVAPFVVSFIENRPVIIYCLDTFETFTSNKPQQELPKKKSPEIGDVILKVNSIPVEKIIEERTPYISGSNYPSLLRNLSYYLMRNNDTAIDVLYQRGDSTNLTTVPCYSKEKINLSKYFQREDTCFKLLPGNIGYIYPPNLKEEYGWKISSEIFNTKGLIIDLRYPPQNETLRKLISIFFPERVSYVKFTKCNPKVPGTFNFFTTDNGDVGGHNPNYYRGKIVVLVNEYTQSHAEFITMALRTAPNAIVIGTTTAGADGDVSHINLPGGIKTAITAIGIYYPDGRETQRVGIVPDITIKPTIKAIREGRDEWIEKAIEEINNYNYLPPSLYSPLLKTHR